MLKKGMAIYSVVWRAAFVDRLSYYDWELRILSHNHFVYRSWIYLAHRASMQATIKTNTYFKKMCLQCEHTCSQVGC